MTMILLLNPGELRDSCQEERAFELSFGREVIQAVKLEGPDIPSRKIGNSQVTKAQGNIVASASRRKFRMAGHCWKLISWSSQQGP